MKAKGHVNNTKKTWRRKPKKSNFAAPKPGLEIVYFKFGLTQVAAGFVETKYMLEKYAAVSYKHTIVDMSKATDNMKSQDYINIEESMEPRYRVSCNKCYSKLDNYDKSAHNWDKNKKKSSNLVFLHFPPEIE